MISHIHPIPAFSDNYIWARHCDEGNSACVVDPGDAVPVIAYLEQHGLNLTDILITHHHPDHIGGLATLANDYAPRIYGPGSSGIKGINQVLGDGDRLTVFGEAFAVIEVPGHTMDHIAYYCADSSFGSP
ncbi:MAG: MBL fold metallo-hydrolase, partial [Gammaproteobacteria bacterium]